MQDFKKSNRKIVEKYKNKFHISKQPGISRKSSVNTINWSSVVKITGNRNNEKAFELQRYASNANYTINL